LMLPESDSLLSAIDELASHLPDRPLSELGRHYAVDVHTRRIPYELIAKTHPVIFRWGLHERLLNLAENYIGLTPALIGADIRRDLSGPDIGSRRWHRDGEDRRELKVIVYASDVTDSSVSFELIPRSKVGKGTALYDDVEMARLVSRKNWRRCLGPRGTVLFCATSDIYHRGYAPDGAAPRTALFYTYTSRRPTQVEDCRAHCSATAIDTMRDHLSSRQWQSLKWY
jgi:hypothetical protein